MELKWHVNGQTGTYELAEGRSRVIVPLRRDEVLTCAEAELAVTASRKMFFNGYQTWTHCPEYTLADRIRGVDRLPKFGVRLLSLDRFADYHFVDYPVRKGIFHGFSWCYFRDGGHYRLFASLDERPGYTVFAYDSGREVLRITRDCKGTAVKGSDFPAFELFYAEGSEQEVFDGWFDAMGVRSAPPRIKGYTSWYNRYQRISAKTIDDDLAGARRLFDPGDLFQIDDGWEPAVGDWDRPHPGKFPDGLGPVAEKIHAAGFKAGLWLAPFVCSRSSAVFRDHPDRLLRYRGKPWRNGLNWGGFYSLDIDHPGVTAYLEQVFSRVFDEWKFDLVKLDFLYAAAPLASGDHGYPSDVPFSESRAARMIRALTLLRHLCRDKLILGCGGPVMPAFGLVDYCRIGPDMSLNWDDLPFMRIIHRERVSTRNSLDNTIFRRQLDGRAFGSDPDVFFLRDKNLSLSAEKKQYLAAVNALFGSVWLTSDDPGSYDSEKTARYRQLAHLREAAEDRRIDPDTLAVRYTLDGREYLLPYPGKR